MKTCTYLSAEKDGRGRGLWLEEETTRSLETTYEDNHGGCLKCQCPLVETEIKETGWSFLDLIQFGKRMQEIDKLLQCNISSNVSKTHYVAINRGHKQLTTTSITTRIHLQIGNDSRNFGG